MLLVKQAYTSTGGTTGGLGNGALELPMPPSYSVLYCAFSTLATTNTYALQSAQQSTGPWFDEGSTAISTAISTALALRVTGPIGPFVRPQLKTISTGQYNLMLMCVSDD